MDDQLDFEAIINSVGHRSVGSIGEDHLKMLTVTGDSHSGTARIEICLQENSWVEQARAIDQMLELRLAFLDDVSIDYVFIEEDATTRESTKRSDYSYA